MRTIIAFAAVLTFQTIVEAGPFRGGCAGGACGQPAAAAVRIVNTPLRETKQRVENRRAQGRRWALLPRNRQ